MNASITLITTIVLTIAFSSSADAGAIRTLDVIDGNSLDQITFSETGINNLKQISLDNQNNLKQIGISDNSGNNLKQIAIGLHDATGTYTDNGSTFVIGGSGTTVFVAPDLGSSGAACFQNIQVRGGISDGTSNTFLFGENTGFGVTPGYATPYAPVAHVIDGTSNTIFFPESGSTTFCFGNTTFDQPYDGEIIDSSTNAIGFGDTSSLDLCFGSARIGTFTDGTSNTISFGETRNNVCFQGLSPDLQDVPEPPTAAMLAASLLALAFGLRFRVSDDADRGLLV